MSWLHQLKWVEDPKFNVALIILVVVLLFVGAYLYDRHRRRRREEAFKSALPQECSPPPELRVSTPRPVRRLKPDRIARQYRYTGVFLTVLLVAFSVGATFGQLAEWNNIKTLSEALGDTALWVGAPGILILLAYLWAYYSTYRSRQWLLKWGRAALAVVTESRGVSGGGYWLVTGGRRWLVTVEFQDHSGNSIREALGRSTEPDPPRYPVGHVLPVLYNPDKPKDFRAYPVTGFEIGEPEISVSPKPLWLLSIALSAGWLIWFLVPRLTSSPLQHFNRGNALLEKARLGRGDWNTLPTAIEEYRRAVRLRPDWAEAHYYLGKAFENKKDWDAAIREYQQAIRLKPDSPEAHLVLGNALYRRGDQEGAIAEYREALRLKPDFAPAHNNLGVVLEQKGDQQAALDEYRKASELDPKHPGYRAAYDKLRKELNR